ncbi:hypothetical protein [Pseudoalteromonas luteoviolacea]|uniref:Uncharacterized protein n=1 Tax=Pseudoalteromonas luteoviolacea S4060-1 TaxID=1365257 RepID=A0A162BWW6_9GAMM|nr:hypothetical protein [Pseudoalteromonas luteoviolacea]KZN70426.1 hypothetical protein N478_00550 [Pseudoalteromonas luteoviolacea S4060-1]
MPAKNHLDNSTFLTQFEDLSLDPVHFDHIGHLRIAFIYLNEYTEVEAIQRVCSGIKVYAESLGAKDKYNLTVTTMLVKIMAGRINSGKDKTWETFLANNQDLVLDAIGVLSQHITKEIMLSEDAKVSVLEPNLKPI